MALEVTHVRFAVDLKNHLEVENICDYVSGSIYPDSRYVTGTDRSLTHPDVTFFQNKRNNLTDFEKGWFTHIICDSIQFRIMMSKFPEIERLAQEQGNERWVKHSALKFIQNRDDSQKFDIKPYLPCLKRTSAPNGEDREKLERYYAMLSGIYSRPEPIDYEVILNAWEGTGLERALIDQIRKSLNEQTGDTRILETVSHLYDEILSTAKAELDSGK